MVLITFLLLQLLWTLTLSGGPVTVGGNPTGDTNANSAGDKIIQTLQFLQLQVDSSQTQTEDLGNSDSGGLTKWEDPQFLRDNFPYYLSGYDDEGRPVWIVEVGKFPVQSLIEGGGDMIKDSTKYGTQAMRRIFQSIEAQNATEGDVNDAFFLLDYDGFDSYQVTNPKALMLRMKLWREYKDVLANVVGRCVIINVSYMADVLIKLSRPVLGVVLERVEIYGTNPDKWKPALRRLLPLQAIPEWYGGSPAFKPVAIYG